MYAGYLSYTDYEIGRLVDHLKEINQYDNTLFVVIVGDNGASKEGSLNGDVDRSLLARPLPAKDNLAHNLARIGEIGTASGTETNYPLGWAQAANTPFRFWKSDANSEGGTRNPLIITYPKGIKDRGIRTQYSHVIDILPTTLDILGLKAPGRIRSVPQQPIEGISLAYSITDAKAPPRHTLQYYYIFGSRAIYQNGWKASLSYPTPLSPVDTNRPFDENAWSLYNLNEDYTERVDLAKKYPEKLAALKVLFEKQAQEHNLYPLITWDDVFGLKIHRPRPASDRPTGK